MKTLLLIPFLALASCGGVDLIVDTSEAVPVGPDRIRVPSTAVTPVISEAAIEEANRQLSEIVIRATK